MHKTRNCSKHTKKKIQLNVEFLLSGMVTVSFLKAYTVSVNSIPVVKQLCIDFCFQLEVSYKNGRAKLYPYFIWLSHILLVWQKSSIRRCTKRRIQLLKDIFSATFSSSLIGSSFMTDQHQCVPSGGRHCIAINTNSPKYILEITTIRPQ